MLFARITTAFATAIDFNTHGLSSPETQSFLKRPLPA